MVPAWCLRCVSEGRIEQLNPANPTECFFFGLLLKGNLAFARGLEGTIGPEGQGDNSTIFETTKMRALGPRLTRPSNNHLHTGNSTTGLLYSPG